MSACGQDRPTFPPSPAAATRAAGQCGCGRGQSRRGHWRVGHLRKRRSYPAGPPTISHDRGCGRSATVHAADPILFEQRLPVNGKLCWRHNWPTQWAVSHYRSITAILCGSSSPGRYAVASVKWLICRDRGHWLARSRASSRSGSMSMRPCAPCRIGMKDKRLPLWRGCAHIARFGMSGYLAGWARVMSGSVIALPRRKVPAAQA